MPVRWNDAVFAVVRRIPRGRVATYGQIALLLGRPRGGREVGWAMHACDDPRVPCHRVVDRNGRLAPHFAGVGPIAQRDRLEREGVRFRGELVDVARYAWSPRILPVRPLGETRERRPR
jgi:methylated-DNA-protein-cysteine methyltransferase-like protein